MPMGCEGRSRAPNRTGKQEEDWQAPLKLSHADLRRAIAERIEADIALLDALDGEPDLEPEILEEQYDAEDVTLRIRGGLAA